MDVRLALTGFGNVGLGVATLLAEQGERYRERYGVNLLLTGVADRGGAAVNAEGLQPRSLLEGKQRNGTVARGQDGVAGLAGEEFLDRVEAQVLLEAASTNFEDAEPGWSYARQSLHRGMDVVLASKGALVLHYDELMSDAARRGRLVRFSGTTGAPLPVLELAERVLIGCEILGFEAIVNATTNQILTSMENGLSYEEGVREAQLAGIAETDPTLDVDGWDAAAKAVIIGRAVMGLPIALADVDREGIRGMTAEELAAARSEGETVKLVARVERRGNTFHAGVRPERRPLADGLGRLRGQEMGIVFRTDKLGTVTSTVQQTGGIPTALTVLRDVINLARDRGWTAPAPG